MQPVKTISILGCGWLGLPLAKLLSDLEYIVKGSTTRAERFEEIQQTGTKPYLIKAENGIWMSDTLYDFLACDILIIAIPPGTKRNVNSTHAIEIKQLMQILETLPVPVKQIIYISSTSIYKNTNNILSESAIQTEADAENKILYDAEQYVQQSNATVKIILRLAGLTGYDRMLARFFAGKTALTGGNEPVNLVHRDDVLGAIVFVLEHRMKNTVLNICSPEHPERADFYIQLCERFGLAAPHFSEEPAPWKKISSEVFTQMGYVWKFPNPYTYTYTYQ